VVVFENGLQNSSEEEDDAVCPCFVVEFAEDGGVAVVFEAEVEWLLAGETDVDVLAERDPRCRLAEAAVCREGGYTVEDASGACQYLVVWGGP